MITEQVLTRNESANKIREVWSTIIENAPEDTQLVRDIGAVAYIARSINADILHEDHYIWLVRALSSEKVLDDVDRLAANAREAGGPLDIPWRDETE